MKHHPSPIELLGYAATFAGIAEIPGAKHEARVVAMLRHVGIRRGGDETPWCAAFVNWVLEHAGVDGTGSAMARSFTHWGDSVPNPEIEARPGDVCVLWRKSRTSASGHVGFFQRFERGGKRICLLGGNQRNRVGSKSYPIGRLLVVRRVSGWCGDLAENL